MKWGRNLGSKVEKMRDFHNLIVQCWRLQNARAEHQCVGVCVVVVCRTHHQVDDGEQTKGNQNPNEKKQRQSAAALTFWKGETGQGDFGFIPFFASPR